MSRSDYLEKSRVYKGFHYSVLKPEMLDYLHKRTLEMFKQVKDIFDANGIKYMICGGTLLGAIGGVHMFRGTTTLMYVFSRKITKKQLNY